jgi:hypothetical protein
LKPDKIVHVRKELIREMHPDVIKTITYSSMKIVTGKPNA